MLERDAGEQSALDVAIRFIDARSLSDQADMKKLLKYMIARDGDLAMLQDQVRRTMDDERPA